MLTHPSRCELIKIMYDYEYLLPNGMNEILSINANVIELRYAIETPNKQLQFQSLCTVLLYIRNQNQYNRGQYK